MTININDIEAQLVANADEIKTALTEARAQRDAVNAAIRDLVAQEKKAERLAAVIRREVAKQEEKDEAVASLTPSVAPAAPVEPNSAVG